MLKDDEELYYLYLIVCESKTDTYIKIGKTKDLYRRLITIKSNCPLPISHAFIIFSPYLEEIDGLEFLFHKELPTGLHGEWYKGTPELFQDLDTLLEKINSGFPYEEIEALPDIMEYGGSIMEIMLHHHSFCFRQIELPLSRKTLVIQKTQGIFPNEIVHIIGGS